MTTFKRESCGVERHRIARWERRFPQWAGFRYLRVNMWSGSAWKKEPEFVLNRWPFDRQYAIFKANN